MDAFRERADRGGACALAGDAGWLGHDPTETLRDRAHRAEARVQSAVEASHDAAHVLARVGEESRGKALELKTAQHELAEARASLAGQRAEKQRVAAKAETAALTAAHLDQRGLLTPDERTAMAFESEREQEVLRKADEGVRQTVKQLADAAARVEAVEREAAAAQQKLLAEKARAAAAAAEVKQSAVVANALAASAGGGAPNGGGGDHALRKTELQELLCQNYGGKRPDEEPTMVEAVKAKAAFRVCDADKCYFVTPGPDLQGEVCVCPSTVQTIAGGCSAAGCDVSDIRVDVGKLMACKMDMS